MTAGLTRAKHRRVVTAEALAPAHRERWSTSESLSAGILSRNRALFRRGGEGGMTEREGTVEQIKNQVQARAQRSDCSDGYRHDERIASSAALSCPLESSFTSRDNRLKSRRHWLGRCQL